MLDRERHRPGMDAEFVRERLFRPFDSTKGSKGMGIGAYQVREYVRCSAGRWKCRAVPDRARAFRLALPAFEPATASCSVGAASVGRATLTGIT